MGSGLNMRAKVIFFLYFTSIGFRTASRRWFCDSTLINFFLEQQPLIEKLLIKIIPNGQIAFRQTGTKAI
jgi:hypothetical protein